MKVLTKKFDFTSDKNIEASKEPVYENTVILFEGIFLFRPEIASYWDYKIFVDIAFENSLKRGIERDSHWIGGKEAARKYYEKRYIPGQKIYFDLVNPKHTADLVIKNDNPESPEFVLFEK